MIVDKTVREGTTVLGLEGTIRLGESAKFFSQTLERTLEDETGHVLIDFSKINYIDSTGIGELVGYLQRFRSRQRKLILVNPSDKIRQLLAIARLDTQFAIYPTIDAALEAEA